MKQYQNFKKTIESYKKIEKKEYNQIVSKYGKELIKQLFEQYISDIEEDDDKKINLIIYYLENIKENNIENNLTTKISKETYIEEENIDLIKQYLKEIEKIPLLSEKEQKDYLTTIHKLRKQIKKRNITNESLNIEIKKIGYPKKIENTPHSRQGQIKFIVKKIEELETKTYNEEELKKLKNLFDDIKLQYEYITTVKKFTESNLALVVYFAKRYTNRGLSFLELISEGNIGLIKSIEKYNIKKGYKFSTYSAFWIKQSMIRAISEQSRTIRIPVYLEGIVKKIKKIKSNMITELGREPTEEELAIKLNLPIEKVKKYIKLFDEPLSLSMQTGDKEKHTLEDIIPDENSNKIEEKVSNILLREILEKELKQLTQKEQKVIEDYFGLKNNDPKSLTEIGKELGVTKTRAYQIKNEALKKIRTPKLKEKLREYL